MLKQNKGLSRFILERYLCINKNFWWFWLFYFGVVTKILDKMSNMKLLNDF